MYVGIVYLRAVDDNNNARITLALAKIKVAPIKCLTIPRLELCGVTISARILNHVTHVLAIPIQNIFAWTDRVVPLSQLAAWQHQAI